MFSTALLAATSDTPYHLVLLPLGFLIFLCVVIFGALASSQANKNNEGTRSSD